ncbi:MAG: LysR family transcriptional regulator [Gammaproteobacteria bacterium]|nr:LysR family transcriptional regulator [Gammaproteobacteria bacterium]
MADRRLQVFHTVARLLSFTKAADSLHMTQPAVTFQVRQLEEYFNTRLFDRTHNRISLTDVGKKVFVYSEQILGLYREMDNDIRTLTGEIIGVLVIGASTTVAEYMLPRLLGEFQALYPKVKLRLKVSNSLGVVHMVENNDIDIGLVESPVLNKSLAVKACWQDNLVVIVAPDHPLAAKESVHVSELKDHPFISREEGSGTRSVLSDYLEKNGMGMNDLDLSMEFGSPEAIKNAVESGLGISVVSETTLIKELKLNTLKAVKIDPPLHRHFSLVHQRQKFRIRAMQEFLNFAHARCDVEKDNDKDEET